MLPYPAHRRRGRTVLAALLTLLSLSILTGCDDETEDPIDADAGVGWAVVTESPEAALLAVHGTSPDDVWMVGADDGEGPVALHWDGTDWQRHATGVRGDLWWVHAFPDGPVFMSGSDAHIVRYEDGAFERLVTPGLGKDTIFGLWGAAPDDVYAVGSSAGRNGFIWHYDGAAWRALPLPADLPQNDKRDVPAFFKVWGQDKDNVWIVGGGGVMLHGNARDGFRSVASGESGLLFTVHGDADKVVVVGGGSNGVLLEAGGDAVENLTPEGAPLLQGVCVGHDGTTWAVGARGVVFRAEGEQFTRVETNLGLEIQSLHAVWVDPTGGVWAVGGNVLSGPLNGGVGVYSSPGGDPFTVPRHNPPVDGCPFDAQAEMRAEAAGFSIARRWNEQLLNAIRRDLPRPTVHARNLFHTSVAMWDAWAAFDDVADGYLVREKLTADDVEAARREAISYAAYRVLSHRYAPAIGGNISQACFDGFMDRLGFDPADTNELGDTARALGNRIGARVIAEFADDGAREDVNYNPPDAYTPINPVMVVDLPGTDVVEPARWQQLIIAEAVSQNGIPEGSGVRAYVGPHWRDVTPFALVRPAPGEPYIDIGEPPLELDQSVVDAAVDVLRKTAQLDFEDGVTMDISPASYGNNPLGTNDGTGHEVNPVTGEPYAPQIVLRGDFTRILAEFWADGPASETPPGHWNTLANDLSYSDGFERRLFGEGESLDPLAWDVHLYLALNGAVHDAAIVAWELKRVYMSARPITLIRYMGGLGQRSEPDGPSYHPDGLPLVPGLIEVITEESAAPGGRHAHLARYVGEVTIYSWRGEPGDRDNEIGGFDWIRAVDWMPYQRRNFVTPPFPGYVSGHSTFSRSAAETLTEITGSPYFPGGLGTYTFEPGYLFFEAGPTERVQFQWATYYDAADQAGQSRLWGGIHIWHDDRDGRIAGDRVGRGAAAKARGYYEGTAVE
ncbi:MAG: vanadium-dependent haloperoxidase [Myxococcales bacterium]|nr:vanadium-dependent haloperoxidase [Myxococcales bacterium]